MERHLPVQGIGHRIGVQPDHDAARVLQFARKRAAGVHRIGRLERIERRMRLAPLDALEADAVVLGPADEQG